MTLPMRPRRMVDVEKPELPLDPNTVLVWEARIWTTEGTGCVMCIEKEPSTISSIDARGREIFYCVRCGWLNAIPFKFTKQYHLEVGGLEPREGDEVINDVFLVPVKLRPAERSELLTRLLDDAQADESG